MFVRNRPLIVNLAEANGGSPPHIELSTTKLRRADMVKAVRESHVISRSDAEIANLIADRALERSEPLFRALPEGIGSDVVQRVNHVEPDDVRSYVGDRSLNIPGADGLFPIIY